MPESQHIEWKLIWRNEFLKWICGFANAEGGVLEIGRADVYTTNRRATGSMTSRMRMRPTVARASGDTSFRKFMSSVQPVNA